MTLSARARNLREMFPGKSWVEIMEIVDANSRVLFTPPQNAGEYHTLTDPHQCQVRMLHDEMVYFLEKVFFVEKEDIPRILLDRENLISIDDYMARPILEARLAGQLP
jgi:hypothetical protein